MASGRLILPLSEPCINSSDQLAVGATLAVYDTGTSNLSTLFSDAGLTVGILNPLTSDSAGRFYAQGTVIWASDAIAYDCTLSFPDGETFTYDQVYLLGAQANVAGFAPLASPVFTGVPEAPSPATNDDSAKIATTHYVQQQNYAPELAPTISNITLTGTTAAPTPATGDDTTSIATTAFVNAEIGAIPTVVSGETTLKFGTSLVKLFSINYVPSGTRPTHPFTFEVPFPTSCLGVIGMDSVNIVGGALGTAGGIGICAFVGPGPTGATLGQESNTGATFSGTHVIYCVAWGN